MSLNICFKAPCVERESWDSSIVCVLYKLFHVCGTTDSVPNDEYEEYGVAACIGDWFDRLNGFGSVKDFQ